MKSEYAKAGVDVEAGYDTVSRIKGFVGKTFDENVLSGLGSFGGFYAIPGAVKMKEPVLIAGTDGVGTKLRLAFILDKHDTVGIDCVAMCVNDIICQGARPLFFLDYLATGKLIPEKAAQIVKGVADGCILAGCALIGGETAEMPGFYGEDEYDLAGFAVGLADRQNVIDGSAIKDGDILIGLASSGAHSNGFSLIRKVFPMTREHLEKRVPELDKTLGEALLQPTRIYVKAILYAMELATLHGIAHITGGGFIENVPRIIPDGLCACIELSKCNTPPLFDLIQKTGNLERIGMYNVFNMGIGMVVSVAEAEADAAVAAFTEAGETACIIGRVSKGEEKVALW
jgi:phosphoribosylformylglycinamidine cyclo-ligase